jgi:hypothetical protein
VRTPPREIAGATVLQFADLSNAVATGATTHVIKGQQTRDFKGLAIAQYDSDPGFYLFYCDADWRAVTDTYHETIEGAIAQADFEFTGLTFIEAGG